MALTLRTLGLVLVWVAGVAADCQSTSLTDGCSIPLGIPFPYSETFRPACNHHDVCYECGGYYGLGRFTCDQTFYLDMKNICRDQGWFFQRRCRRYARIYTAAVLLGGGSTYKFCGGGNYCITRQVDNCLATEPRRPTNCSGLPHLQ